MPLHPWSSIPAARSSAPVLRVKLAIVFTLLALAVITGPASLVMVLTRPTPAPVVQGTPISMTTAAAQIIATDFLAGRPTLLAAANGTAADPSAVSQSFSYPSLPLPHGHLAYRQLVFAGSSQRTDNLVTYELDYFLVETPTTLYTMTVPMLDTPQGPVLGALPSLTTYTPATSNALDPLDYSTDVGFTLGNTAYPNYASYIQNAVAAWATAFAAGNQAGLQAVAQYPVQPVYPALGGFVAGAPTITAEVATATGLYVRVAVPLRQGRFATVSSYDLLVTNADSASPQIVSWGPAGAAPLSRFS